MTKLEIVSGCYNTELLIDGKDIDEVSEEEIKSIVLQILSNSNKSTLISVLELLVNELGETIDDKDPCEQCGAWTGVTTLNLG